MRKSEIVAKIREYSKFLGREQVKNQIQKEFGLSDKVYSNILEKFMVGPKSETVIAEIDGVNVIDLHQLICELATLKRENKDKYDRLAVQGKIVIVGQKKLS